MALNLVLVVPTIGDVALPDGIPLENLKLGIALDALLGFAVDFVNTDFDRPLIVWWLLRAPDVVSKPCGMVISS